MAHSLRSIAVVLAASLFTPASRAQDASALPAAVPPPPAAVSGVVVTARRPTHVAAVTVTATDWCPEPDPSRHPSDVIPRVIDSYPRPGAVVAPGHILVRVTFDAPMSCYSEVMTDGGVADPCAPTGTWELPDRRTWVMQCQLEPQTDYQLQFKKIDGEGFVGLSGRRAYPYTLDFKTSAGPATPSFEAAQSADPGPPGGRPPTAAYVTCADQRGMVEGRDCQHEVFRHPSP